MGKSERTVVAAEEVHERGENAGLQRDGGQRVVGVDAEEVEEQRDDGEFLLAGDVVVRWGSVRLFSCTGLEVGGEQLHEQRDDAEVAGVHPHPAQHHAEIERVHHVYVPED